MSPTRRQIITAGGCAALGVAGCSAAEAPTAPATIKAADVPVGGGIVLKDAPYVVTQPTRGEFRAFSAMCTHSACKVSRVTPEEGVFCGCHGSTFTLEDAKVVRGPATKPLPSVPVKTDGDSLTVG